MGEMKICNNCENEKELSELSYREDKRKYRNQCRDCIKLINEEDKTKNKEKIKIRREDYSEKTKKLEENV